MLSTAPVYLKTRKGNSSGRIFSTGTCFKGICSVGMDLATLRRHLSSPSSGVALFGCSHEVMLGALCLSSFLLSQAINFDSPRGGISLVTEKGPVTSSRLLIQKAIERDAGLYTCSPSNTHSSSVHVHIVNGKWKENKFQFSNLSLFSFEWILLIVTVILNAVLFMVR